MLGLRTRARRLRHGLDYGRMVHERGRFALNEAINRNRIAEYRPQGSKLPISLRHHYSPDGTPSNDTWTLREIFRDDCYAPPAAVDELLRDRTPLRILDLGANVGLFAAYILGVYPTAEIIAFEPDPDSAGLLTRSLGGRITGARFTVHQACATTQDGAVVFAPGRHQFSHIAAGDEPGVIRVPTMDVLPLLQVADLAKIDVEGGEWELLADQRFGTLGPRNLVMEYHERMCPEPDARTCAVRLLEERGYKIVPDSNGARPDEPILWAQLSDNV